MSTPHRHAAPDPDDGGGPAPLGPEQGRSRPSRHAREHDSQEPVEPSPQAGHDRGPAAGSAAEPRHDHGPAAGTAAQPGHDHGPAAGSAAEPRHDHGPAAGTAAQPGHDHGPAAASAGDPTRPHDSAEEHGHEHGETAGHAHPTGLLSTLRELVSPHSHDAADSVDSALETSARGTRALIVSLAVLGGTALLQALVFLYTGSVALLGDTLHNVADALTAVPLAIAFSVGRRPSNRRYTYGYGRAEDLAGIAVVGFIVASSVLAAYEAVQRLLHPRPVHHLVAVAVAGLLGFVGNEVVARYRISVGREIGSAALVADGLHARTDGFTSLAVVLGAIGVALGFQQADPIIGLLITVAILSVLKNAARQVYRRLMDAVDESLVDDVERVLRGTQGVRGIGEVRVRWIGHALRAEAEVVVAADLSLADGHRIAVEAEHQLLHSVRRLTAAFIHADPEGGEHHALTSHHQEA